MFGPKDIAMMVFVSAFVLFVWFAFRRMGRLGDAAPPSEPPPGAPKPPEGPPPAA